MVDKHILLKEFTTPGEKLLFAKVLDQALFCLKNKAIYFSDFLDPVKINVYSEKLKLVKNLSMTAFGGDDTCERKILGFSPDFLEIDSNCFPISIVQIKKNTREHGLLTHRDCLGSILGLGLDRMKIGDIEISDDVAFAFVHNDIAEYIEINLAKVSRIKVHTEIISLNDASIVKKQMKTFKITVASLRADVIIASAFNISRSKAKNFITGEKLFINWTPVHHADVAAREGDIITLRGFGRIKFIKLLGYTKKGRLLIELQKY